MSEIPATWSIVGARNVGGALIDMVAKPRVAAEYGLRSQPDYVLRTDGWHEQGSAGEMIESDARHLPDSDILFIASPSTPDHEPMLSLMGQQLALGRTLITAEKGVLSEHFAELTDTSGQIGYWATVGGGTKLLPSLELHTRDPDNIREIHLALNATLTYIFGEVESGNSQVGAVDAAKKLGYAEPEATGVNEVIAGEASGDVPRKLAIVWNTIFPQLATLPIAAIQTDLTEEHVQQALNEADKYRYIVSLFHQEEQRAADIMTRDKLGGFEISHEGWLIAGGLQRVDRTNSLARFRRSKGPDAGFYVTLGPGDKSTNDGETFLLGTGAGGSTTANAMLDNYRTLIPARVL